MFSHFSVLHTKPSQAGFSLIELLVSIGIIVLVLSIVITQQSTFNSAVLLRSQAYEIALAVREVQLSAVSATSDGAGDFRSVLGVSFSDSVAGNQRYVTFIDDGDQWYDSDTAFGPPGLLDQRFEIADVRYNGVSVPGNQVSITFERPNFDARFKTSAGGALLRTGTVQMDVGVAGSTGTVCGEDIRTIEITAAGQVTVLECP